MKMSLQSNRLSTRADELSSQADGLSPQVDGLNPQALAKLAKQSLGYARSNYSDA